MQILVGNLWTSDQCWHHVQALNREQNTIQKRQLIQNHMENRIDYKVKCKWFAYGSDDATAIP